MTPKTQTIAPLFGNYAEENLINVLIEKYQYDFDYIWDFFNAPMYDIDLIDSSELAYAVAQGISYGS